MKLALDAMGGDFAPAINIDGAKLALRDLKGIEKIFLVGMEDVLREECQRAGILNDKRIEIVHAPEVVTMEESGLMAVRQKKKSSMSIAVDLVKEGRADAVLSAGNTGAAVAASTIKLRLLPGIERAGIVSPIPNEKGYVLVTDTGANPDAKPVHLVGYAVMAAMMSRYVYQQGEPTVAVMSNGTEDKKGSEFSKEAHSILRGLSNEGKLPFRFEGNCEGHDIFHGEVDVILTDGFTGNILLKTVEATAKTFSKWLKAAIGKNPLLVLGALLMKPAFKVMKKKLNADAVGGSPLMGVNGVSIIAHGSASEIAIYNAIRMAEEMCQNNVNGRIVDAMKQINAEGEDKA